MQVLVKNGISSAPVWNAQAHCYVGMLDYRDIVEFVLMVLNRQSPHLDSIIEEDTNLSATSMASLGNNNGYGIREILEEARRGKAIPASAVSGIIVLLIHSFEGRLVSEKSVLFGHG